MYKKLKPVIKQLLIATHIHIHTHTHTHTHTYVCKYIATHRYTLHGQKKPGTWFIVLVMKICTSTTYTYILYIFIVFCVGGSKGKSVLYFP